MERKRMKKGSGEKSTLNPQTTACVTKIWRKRFRFCFFNDNFFWVVIKQSGIEYMFQTCEKFA